MAYLTIVVGGNPNFGGYLSIDGTQSFQLVNDMTYELPSGLHHFEIFSRSDSQRNSGQKLYAFNTVAGALGGRTGMIGSISGAINENHALNSMGYSWTFQASVGDDQVLILQIVSQGNEILGAPDFLISPLDQETITYLQTFFAQQKAEQEAQERAKREEKEERERLREIERNTPRRSKPKIIVGSILSGLSLPYILFLGLMSTVVQGASGVLVLAVVPLAVLVVGLVLLMTGLQKKIR